MAKTIHRPILSILTTLMISSVSYADSGAFSTLTYNVAGLPELISSAESNREAATEIISCYVKEFDVVNVQEDFNYHAALYDSCDDHPYRSSTSGGAGIGSGLNTLSRYPYSDWDRVRWHHCNGVDCLTPKGFTMARTRLAKGVYVDIYNLHTQAQIESADLKNRRKNITQLIDYINKNSSGNAVIIMGDTNTRYTRSGDNPRALLNSGFTDAWINLIRGGNVPNVDDANALVCDPKVTDYNCEIVDKIFYRSNRYVNLSATLYNIRDDDRTNNGLLLSDHPPIETDFSYSTTNGLQMSDYWGGDYGTAYNDVNQLPLHPLTHSVVLRAGKRVDQLAITLQSGQKFTHGGAGGTTHSLTLRPDEHLTSLKVCKDEYHGKTRIFYARFLTSRHRSISGGTETSDCKTFHATNGWQIVGFHGRSGDELDKVGVIYAPY